MLRLTAETRGLTKSARNQARRRGMVPGVLYGKDQLATPLMVSRAALREALRAGARNKMIELSGPVLGQPCKVMIKEVQFDPAGDATHVDFFRPTAGRRIHVRVPVVVAGEQQLIKRGILFEHQLHEVECSCMPEDAPEALYVDVSNFEPGEHVSLKNLRAPTGVDIIGDPEMVVVTVERPMAVTVPENVIAEITTGA